MNLIFGSAGFAKELDWLVNEIYYKTGEDFRTDYFVVADEDKLVGTSINSCELLPETEIFKRFAKSEINAFIGVGNPKIKKIIVDKIINNIPQCRFPNLIHPDVTYDNRPDKIMMGKGVVICSKNVLTTDITIGNFVHINLDCTIGHDTVIRDYVTLSPGVHLSGYVIVEDNVFIGTGSAIIERLTICKDTIIGAGSILTKNITEYGLYVGCPARKVS